jgi:predicted RNase H-like nuclease (RuvC/YqgF family)
MIESIMYMGIGLLAGCLFAVGLLPLVHDRAVRLTVRRLEASLPECVEEIEADKDLLRAEFAMSARRLEMVGEQLKNKIASQLVELSRKSDAINRLKIERDYLKTQISALRAQIAALKKQLDAPYKEDKAKIPIGAFLRQWAPHRAHH